MKRHAGGLGEAVERLLPFLTMAAILTAGWFWVVQPRFGAYLRARTDTAALEERVRTLQQATGRALPQSPADLSRTQQEFEARVSAEDEVAEVAAALAKAVLANAPAGELRSFVIETGDRMSPPPRGVAGDATGTRDGSGADPRLSLFPYAVSYTPLRVSFDSTFEAAGNLLWQLRDFPTVVEVRSATLTRGLPLMRFDLLVRVLQRANTADALGDTMPVPASPAAPGPTAPRLAPSAAEAGALR